ncbi:unnamed protein product, partial [Mesorhabditis belari]|uniref:Uncharacterized protein n=1 Tax=Mesorhabditis belari TaxID=2138241 RepID=A0AAF3EQW4_9BILA
MDSFKQTVALYTVGGSGTALNFVLLYLISTDKAAFIIDESGFLVFSKNLHKLGFWYSYVMTTVYIIAFEMSLSLLGIHCFYRYAKITGKYSSIFEKWYMILLVVIGYFVIAIIYGLNCALDMAGLAPVIFDYTPAMCTIWGGFIGLPLHEVAMYMPIMIASYSPAEALMVIFGFTAYRRRILKMVKLRSSDVSVRQLSEIRRPAISNLSIISNGNRSEITKKSEEISYSSNVKQ